jgi:hypothetical protein
LQLLSRAATDNLIDIAVPAQDSARLQLVNVFSVETSHHFVAFLAFLLCQLPG